jgi:HAMP domain-containing protein
LPIDRLSRRIVAAAFVLLFTTAVISIVFLALARSVSEGLVEAQIASGAPETPLIQLADVLVWGQVGTIAALSLLTGALFGFAWYLRARVLAPLEALHRSLMEAASGALARPVSGVERGDEIGAAARAADQLREAVAGGPEEQGLHGLKPLIERLVKDAGRLEADLARLSSTTTQARAAIEDASLRAAKASYAAIEAAGLVRDGAERMTLRAEDSIAGLTAAIAHRPYMSTHAGASEPVELAGRFAADEEAASVLTSLAGDLEALERFAHDRKTIASESAAALTVALVEAIDRLNGVADRISATADLGPKSEAA